MLLSHFQIAGLFLIGLSQKEQIIKEEEILKKSKKTIVYYYFEIIHVNL